MLRVCDRLTLRRIRLLCAAPRRAAACRLQLQVRACQPGSDASRPRRHEEPGVFEKVIGYLAAMTDLILIVHRETNVCEILFPHI